MKRRDYVETLFTFGSITVSSFLLYKLTSYFFGNIGFSEFSLIKRIIAFLVPLFSIGMGVSVPREIARADNYNKENDKYLILRFATFAIIFLGLILVVSVRLFSEPLSSLFFSDEKFSYLLFPMSLTIFGLLFIGLVVSYTRGLNKIRLSNVALLINTGFLPVVLMFFSKNIAEYFFRYGVLMIAVNLSIILFILFRKKVKNDFKVIRDFFSYGLRRVPGDMALEGMFIMPPMFAAHFGDILLAGGVSFGIAIMNLIVAPLHPASAILLPHGVKMLKEEGKEVISGYVNKMLLITISFSSILALGLFFLAPIIVRFFIENGNDYAVYVIRGIAVSSIPFAVYVILRSFIDAASSRAYNAVNMVISLLLYVMSALLLSVFLDVIGSIVIGMVLAFYALGFLTFLRMMLIIRGLKE